MNIVQITPGAGGMYCGNCFRDNALVAGLRRLEQHPHPDVICLSNALLVGLVRKLKQELRSPVVCMLQGEDYFLDSLPQSQRELAWKTLAERAAEVDVFIAPSSYFAELMGKRLN